MPSLTEAQIVLPLAYFGNVEYFHLIAKANSVIIDIAELYPKQTYRNRCTILGANGPIDLSVPIIRPQGKNTALSNVLISYAENWTKDHLKSIESAYGRTPFFEYYFEDLETIIRNKPQHLAKLDNALAGG